MSMDVWIGCVRIPDVPAWAFRQVKEAEDPFVVVERNRVVGASRTPRRAGVELGMTCARATSLCEDATTRPRNPTAEKTSWEALLRSLNTYTPRIKSVRPGLAWFEPRRGGRLRRWLKGRKCHCGAAPNRPVARLAAWKAAPGRIICIEKKHEASFLSRVPTDALSEVGFFEEIAERLCLFGYENLNTLRELTRRHLTAQFGEEGDRLFDFLHPAPKRVSFYSPPPSVTVTRDFERPVREPGPLQKALKERSETLVERLEGKSCQHLTVRLSGRDQERETSRVLREPVASPGPLYRTGSTLLTKALTADIEVRSLILEGGGLESASGSQKTLFQERPRLKTAIATIQEKCSDALCRIRRNEGAVFREDRYTFEPVATGS